MMFPRAVLDEIVAGRIDLAFRRWTRRMHSPGGSQRTAVGVIAFDAVEVVNPQDVTAEEAVRAGSDLATLRQWLQRKPNGDLYRIQVRYAGVDERVTLRDAQPTASECEQLATTLAGMDRRSNRGHWTQSFLELIDHRPAELAETLAESLGWAKVPFKTNVRKLKELGLTESLQTGYRLSPRGQALLDHLQRTALR